MNETNPIINNENDSINNTNSGFVYGNNNSSSSSSPSENNSIRLNRQHFNDNNSSLSTSSTKVGQILTSLANNCVDHQQSSLKFSSSTSNQFESNHSHSINNNNQHQTNLNENHLNNFHHNHQHGSLATNGHINSFNRKYPCKMCPQVCFFCLHEMHGKLDLIGFNLHREYHFF